MTILILIDIIGSLTGIAGCILVGQLKKEGYLLFMFCNAAYLILGIFKGMYGLVAVSIVMFIIDVVYYIKWRNNERITRIS